MDNFDSELFVEKVEVLGKIDPASYNSAQNTGYISAANHRRFVLLAQVGLIAATGTFDLKLQMAQDGSGTGVIDIPGKAITQLADTADNKVLVIELKSDEIPEGYTHLRGVATPATAASLASCVLLGLAPRYAPVPTTNIHQAVI